MKFLKLDIQLFAHHKGQGSTSNGRDSAGRRLGAKAADGEFITAGSIIYRQRGTRVFPGTNTRRGKDDTIYSTIDGIVKFERLGRDRKQASVYYIKQIKTNEKNSPVEYGELVLKKNYIYILEFKTSFTMNKEVDSNNVEVYVSTLERTDTGFNLNDITDELEWKVVQEAVDEMGDL